MKIRITDLLDRYEDSTVRLDAVDRAEGFDASGKEIIAVKEGKHRFGWREGLALAGALAAVAALVVFASGVLRRNHEAEPRGGVADTPPSTEIVLMPTPTEPKDTEPTKPAEPMVETIPIIQLTDEERTARNVFLTKFAEQSWTDYDRKTMDEYGYARFALYYYKINDWKAITLQDGYETLTLSQVNDVVDRCFGKRLSPVDGTDYTEQRGETLTVNGSPHHEQFRDGVFWMISGDGGRHSQFAVCEDETYAVNSQWRQEFRVYDVVDYKDIRDKPDYGFESLSLDEAEELVRQGKLARVMYGGAVLWERGDSWQLWYYEAVDANEVDDPGSLPEHSDDWEEEWPTEYPVENYKLQSADGGSVFAQTGELNVWRYEQLPAAEDYVSILQGYLDELKESSGSNYNCGELTVDAKTEHDGYANHFAQNESEQGQGASLSGSSVTGRFSFSLWPGQYAALLAGKSVSDRAALEEAARSFVRRFEGITGQLVLQQIEDETLEFFPDPRDVHTTVQVNALRFRFTAAPEKAAHPTLTIQDGLEVPVTCGDSTLDNLGEHSFSVTVLPDGTVANANNYITLASPIPDGTIRMIDESDMKTLLGFFTSYEQDDTMVITSIRASCFSVYFGSALIEPTITVEYYLESDPGVLQTTDMVHGPGGLFD